MNDYQTQVTQGNNKATSGLAVAGLVIGILAVLASFLPIINNGAFIIAIVGLVLSIAGRSQTKKSGSGSGMAVAGIVLNILAIVITLMVQAACSAALDSMTTNGKGTVASVSQAQGAGGSAEKADTSNMAVGQTVEMDNGLSITVNSITPGLANYDNSTVTGVSVTIVNNGTSGGNFNELDWKAEDASGTQRSMTYYSEAVDELHSGTLSPGGSVTGNIYFEEPVVKVYYYSNLLSSDSNIAWVAS